MEQVLDKYSSLYKRQRIPLPCLHTAGLHRTSAYHQ
jgi:hypothetical protein